MPRVERVLLTNVMALKRKYGRRYPRVADAIRALIAADAERGLISRLISLDDEAAMRRVGGAAIADITDQRTTKASVDAVCAAFGPDYVTLLGAPDVVPHQDLINPVYDGHDDDDEFVPSDLPYACDAPYGTAIEAFRGPTRVVGRLPDLNGAADAAYFARVLHTAATYRKREFASYAAYFGLTAAVWRKSTELSLRNLFGPGATSHRAPPEGPNWRKSQIAPLAHFVNCHGGPADPKFYGQRGDSYPTAMDAAKLEDKVRSGTIVAAECCYGAELYPPRIAEGQAGICNTYLGRGAYAFFGSSTIAYGPSEGNGSADLICQFFVQRVLAGASTGRAALEARQKFALHASHLDPTDLKTLAQFSLMGDPAVHAVGRAEHALTRTRAYRDAFTGDAASASRTQRRRRLLRDGRVMEATTGMARTPRSRAARAVARATMPAGVRAALERAVRDAGLTPRGRLSFDTSDPTRALRQPGARRRRGTALSELHRDAPTAFHVVSGSAAARASGRKRGVIVVATMHGRRLVRLRRLHRRG